MSYTHVFPRWARIVSVAAIAACTDSDGPTVPRAIYILVSRQVVSVLPGDSSTFQVSLSTNGDFSGVPQLTLSGVPSGVAARITVNRTSPSIASAVIIINAGADAAPGTYALQVMASDNGVDAVSIPFSLRVVFREQPCTMTDLCAQWARSAIASSQYTSANWSASQATGVPDVSGCSDDPHSWAAAEPHTQEWLEVEFEHSVYPTKVEVFENFGTSSIVKVEVRDEASAYHTVYAATPGLLDCPRVLTLPVSNVEVKVKVVRIHFDQRSLQEWNEVDAVRLSGYRQK